MTEPPMQQILSDHKPRILLQGLTCPPLLAYSYSATSYVVGRYIIELGEDAVQNSRQRAVRMGSCSQSATAGFTLIEVLVVVAIIALLVAILLPSLTRARELATGAACGSNMHQIAMAMHVYTSEQKSLPGTSQVFWAAWEQAGRPGTGWPDWKASDSWVGLRHQEMEYDLNKQQELWAHIDATVPQQGSLYKYLKNEKVYLCPKDRRGLPDPNDPKGGGGNGVFSYTMNGLLGFNTPEHVNSFTYVADFRQYEGALPVKREVIPAGTRVTWSSSRMILLMEEHPWNNLNHGWVNDSMSADSFLVFRHSPSRTEGRGNFAFVDGHVEMKRHSYSVTRLNPTGRGKIQTLQGLDIFNEYLLPYDHDGNAGGAANETTFMRQFKYPYLD